MLSELRFARDLPRTATMPMLFIGHGSPMNAVEENEFSRGWRQTGERLGRPAAILCVSAHWYTEGTHVTAMERPRTIHDFYGFPRELFAVSYPAPGAPAIARELAAAGAEVPIGLDETWGLDHGAWSVLRHLYPGADVPVLQLSIDATRPPAWHFALAKELAWLRERGVLILASGNIVHHLGMMDWGMPHGGFDWAVSANASFRELIAGGEHGRLIDYRGLGEAARLSIPTPDHYLPLLYVLGLRGATEDVAFFNDKLVMGSVSMTSLVIGEPRR